MGDVVRLGYCPKGQGLQLEELCPGPEYVPTAHCLHFAGEMMPTKDENVPSGQSRQALIFGTVKYFPDGHTLQYPNPGPENIPAEQCEHSVAPTVEE